MSGFVPKRVSRTRTAMGSTDANSTGKNGHSIISTIGRRSTLLRGIQTRSFGSMFQIDYINAAGNKCRIEEIKPTYSKDPIVLSSNTNISLTVFRDGFTAGFVRKSLQNSLVSLYGGNVFTDEFCAMGNINGNYGNNIKVPTNLSTGGSTSGAAGRNIIAIERWLTGGWSAFTNGGGADPNGLVLVVDGVANFPVSSAPVIKLSGVNGDAQFTAQEIQYCGSGGNISNFGGVDIGDFVVILYGGDNNATRVAIDADFISGLAPNKSKKFTLQFIDT